MGLFFRRSNRRLAQPFSPYSFFGTACFYRSLGLHPTSVPTRPLTRTAAAQRTAEHRMDWRDEQRIQLPRQYGRPQCWHWRYLSDFLGLLPPSGEPGIAVICLMSFGACCGFLLYNLPPASIFMGDAGSLFLGYSISAIAAYLSQTYSETHIEPALRWAPILLVSIPIYDFISVNFLRIKRGQAPWIGDKNHISHRLVRLGLSRRGAVLCIYLATALSGLPSLLSIQLTGQTFGYGAS